MKLFSLLCVVFFAAEWQFSAVKVEASAPLARFRPCLGTLYFDKLSDNLWKGVIDLAQYKEYDDIVAELRFKNDVYLTSTVSNTFDIVIGRYQPLALHAERPIPDTFEFNIKQTSDGVPALLEFTVDNVTLCNDGIKASMVASRNASNYSEDYYKCGKRSAEFEELVSRKVEASPGEWPWYAAVYTFDSYRCGGTIVSRTAVITVGYCIESSAAAKDVDVIVSITDATNNDDEVGRQKRKALQYFRHSEYSGTVGRFDYKLALIKVERFEFTKYVQPICLYSGYQRNLNGNDLTAVGVASMINKNYHLKSTDIVMQDNVSCKTKYTEHINNITFCCATSSRSNFSPAEMNGGSGLVLPSIGADQTITWYLRGIDYLCKKVDGVPNTQEYELYFDVETYYNWIKQHANE